MKRVLSLPPTLLRLRRQPDWYGHITEHADMTVVDHLAFNVCDIAEPQTIEEALASDHAEEWRAAAENEYQSLERRLVVSESLK